MKSFCKKIAIVLFFCWGMLPALAWARITVDPSFTGTLIVTSPSGEVTLFEPGDSLPAIDSKSTLEVFDGAFTLHTEAGDEVSVGCFGNGQGVGGGSTAALSCGENSGLLKLDGKEIVIPGPKATDQVAPATADSDTGGAPGDEDSTPDSRSIQASISQ